MVHISVAQGEKDCRDIAVLAEIVWHHTYDPLIGSQQVDYMLEKFQSTSALMQDMQDHGYCYFIARGENGQIVGYCGVKPDSESVLFLSKLYVSPVHRREGIAKLFMEHLTQEYRSRGFRKVWLTVNKHNQNAITAYEKMGFHKSGDLITDIGNNFVMDDYTMELIWQQ